MLYAPVALSDVMPIDLVRHVLDHEVKAATRHGLLVEPSEGGWLAEIILDI